MDLTNPTFYQTDSFPVDESTVSDRPALVIVAGDSDQGVVWVE